MTLKSLLGSAIVKENIKVNASLPTASAAHVGTQCHLDQVAGWRATRRNLGYVARGKSRTVCDSQVVQYQHTVTV